MDSKSCASNENGHSTNHNHNEDMHLNNSNNNTNFDGVKQGKRRTKNDPDTRNFSCGCGKSYLSYAALYTHIKTKHDGITPEGTSQPTTSGKSGRGRPKKEDIHAKTREDLNKSDDESVEPEKSVQEFLGYLTKLGQKFKYDSQLLKDPDNSIIISSKTPSVKTDAVESFPTDIFGNNHAKDYEAILGKLKELNKENFFNMFIDNIDPNTELKLTKLNRIFGIFLYQMSQYIKEEFYRELCFFICMYRKALNQEEHDRKNEQNKTSTTRVINNNDDICSDYCGLYNGEDAPNICNKFITDSLPVYFGLGYNLKNFKVLGYGTVQTKNAVFLTQYFCNWLYANKYTNSKLIINPEETQFQWVS